MYRPFCRIDHDEVPDASTLCRSIAALGPEVVEAINARLVAVALSEGIVSGKKLRVDTTVVETNVHYPTDSTLLADAIRVVVRSLKQLGVETTKPEDIGEEAPPGDQSRGFVPERGGLSAVSCEPGEEERLSRTPETFSDRSSAACAHADRLRSDSQSGRGRRVLRIGDGVGRDRVGGGYRSANQRMIGSMASRKAKPRRGTRGADLNQSNVPPSRV